MTILIKLDTIMLKKNFSLKDLSSKTLISNSTLSMLESNKAKIINLSVLDKLCKSLNCQPSDLLIYIEI